MKMTRTTLPLTSVAIAIAVCSIVRVASAAVMPYTAWIASIGSANDDSGPFVVTDSNGNTYVDGNVSLGSGNATLFGNPVPSPPNSEAYLAKFSPSGKLIWDSVSTSAGKYYGIAVDSSGNIYAAANSSVQKYNSAGALQWSSAIGQLRVYGVAVTQSGSIYATGINGGQSTFVSSISSSGQLLWTRNPETSTTPTSSPSAIAVDSAGNVFVAGVNYYNFNTSNLQSNGFAAEFDSNGNLRWNPQFGSQSSFATAGGIAVDSSNNVYIGGTGPSLFGENANGLGTYLLKYSSSDSLQWINRFSGSEAGQVQLGPNGTEFIDGQTGFLQYDSAGNGLPTAPGPNPSALTDFDVSNGSLYYATAVFEQGSQGVYAISLTDVVVPEPSTLVLLGTAGVCATLVLARRRRSRCLQCDFFERGDK